MLNIACLLSGKSSAHDCYPTDKPSVSAVLFGCHGINLLKNLVSRELLRILENFHFSISISKHFDFTFHFSKKSESILISLCTSRKRVKAFFFHFALLEKEWKLFIFTFHFSNFKNPLSLVPVLSGEFAKNTSNNSLHRHFTVYKNVSLSAGALSQCALVAVGMWAQVTSLVITP